MSYPLEYVILDFESFFKCVLGPTYIMFSAKACLAYFRREKLDSPPPGNPPAIVLAMPYGPCFPFLPEKVMEVISE